MRRLCLPVALLLLVVTLDVVTATTGLGSAQLSLAPHRGLYSNLAAHPLGGLAPRFALLQDGGPDGGQKVDAVADICVHGVRLGEECVCADGWEGATCANPTTAGCKAKGGGALCSGRGRCVDNACQCSSGFAGALCEFTADKMCKQGCSGHGLCLYTPGRRPACVCTHGFFGDACQFSGCQEGCSGHGQCVVSPAGNMFCQCEVGYRGKQCADRVCPDCVTGHCEDDRCVCDQGFSGPTCDRHECPAGCQDHGVCDYESGNCTCAPGWGGEDCSFHLERCPAFCSGRGQCDETDGCQCVEGWTGDACQKKACPNQCSGHGKCDPDSRQCVCQAGFAGEDCSRAVCPQNCTHGVCVAQKCYCKKGWSGPGCDLPTCPNQCSGHGVCLKGSCQCEKGWFGGDCSQRSCSSQDCGGRGECDGKTGLCVCNAGWKSSNGGLSCDTQVCDKKCSGHGQCLNSTCVCDAGDKNGRGGWFGDECQHAICPQGCSEGDGRGVCVDKACVCAEGFWGEACEKKECPHSALGSPLAWTGEDESRNVNPNSLSKEEAERLQEAMKEQKAWQAILRHKGERCAGHGECLASGLCACEQGWTGKACDEKSCPNDCSGHGICMAATGLCQCDAFHTGADCSTAVPTLEDGSPQGCPRNCSGNGVCFQGKCLCRAGVFQGADCSQRVCPGGCGGHGHCDGATGQCVCDDGWGGDGCDRENWCTPSNCNGHGRCAQDPHSGKGYCECDDNYMGEACQLIACGHDCSHHGQCVNFQCFCHPGFYGPHCEREKCPNACSDHGVCRSYTKVPSAQVLAALAQKRGKDAVTPFLRLSDNSDNMEDGEAEGCRCDPGWGGVDCSRPVCPNQCSGHGVCHTLDDPDRIPGLAVGVGWTQGCLCFPPYTGEDCSVHAPQLYKQWAAGLPDLSAADGNHSAVETGVFGRLPDTVPPPLVHIASGSEQEKHRSCGAGDKTVVCVRGVCDDVQGKCVCEGGFGGGDCSRSLCATDSDASGCNGRGVCRTGPKNPKSSVVAHLYPAKPYCQCFPPYTGPRCEHTLCTHDCSGNGWCVDFECRCLEGFYGPRCEHKTCPGGCNQDKGWGTCDADVGECLCGFGRQGVHCQKAVDHPCGPLCPVAQQGTHTAFLEVGEAPGSGDDRSGSAEEHKKSAEAGSGSGDDDEHAVSSTPHGYCDLKLRRCVCQEGWAGDQCEIRGRQAR